MYSLSKSRTIGRHQKINKSLSLQIMLLIISVSMALFAVFGMQSWAEASALQHALQHVLLFVGGVGVGSAILISRKRDK